MLPSASLLSFPSLPFPHLPSVIYPLPFLSWFPPPFLPLSVSPLYLPLTSLSVASLYYLPFAFPASPPSQLPSLPLTPYSFPSLIYSPLLSFQLPPFSSPHFLPLTPLSFLPSHAIPSFFLSSSLISLFLPIYLSFVFHRNNTVTSIFHYFSSLFFLPLFSLIFLVFPDTFIATVFSSSYFSEHHIPYPFHLSLPSRAM